MRQVRWTSWTAALGLTLLLVVPIARADVTSDQAAAVVVWPAVSVGEEWDTLLQLSNTSTEQITAHCFYLNANSHCTNNGEVCATGADCVDSGRYGLCLPGWNETDFRIRITGRQPIAWLASEGLLEFCNPNQTSGEPCIPINGTSRRGPNGQSNTGTRILPVPEFPFIGELKCIVVDNNSGDPIVLLPNGTSANVLKGEATVAVYEVPTSFDVSKYNAIGIKALPIDRVVDDGDPRKLTLLNNEPDGDVGEYEGCPNVLILNHFFDFALNPVSKSKIFTFPVFVPCTEDLLNQEGGVAVAQYLIFNEFEQRFSTSNTVDCFWGGWPLSFIDTTQPQRSLFNVGIAGTLTGQTRVSAIGSGLLAVQVENHGSIEVEGPRAAVNVHYQGRRAAADTITLP